MKIQTIITLILGIIALAITFPPEANAKSSPSAKQLTEISPLSGDFSSGYRAGYKKAYPFGLCPLPPLPPLGRNSYEDGFGMGYAQGMLDKNN